MDWKKTSNRRTSEIAESYSLRLFFMEISQEHGPCNKTEQHRGPFKQRIRHEIRQITSEMVENIRDACYYRFAICQERNGAHFKHLLH
jgi:hypothetical protein